MFSESKPILTIDIGGTKTSAAIFIDKNLSLLDKVVTPPNPAEVVRFIIHAARSQKNITAVGIGAPGPLNAEKGVMLTPPNLPGWHGFPLVSAIESELGIPVCLENDANLGALGEAIYGSGCGMKSIFYLTISTGIGSGLIIDSVIHSGRCGMAGELWAFHPDSFQGNTKGSNIIDLCSGPGMLKNAQRLTGNNQLKIEQFLQEAMHGVTPAMEILEDARNAISSMLATVILIVAPEAVVMGGGLCTNSQWFVEPVKKKIHDWIDIPQLARTPVCRAELWDNAVLYGAGILARCPKDQ